jgi:hypothetical protein
MGVPDPAGLDNEDRSTNLIGLDGFNRQWVQSAIEINDDCNLSKETREERIHQLFKDNGYDVKFINEYPE